MNLLTKTKPEPQPAPQQPQVTVQAQQTAAPAPTGEVQSPLGDLGSQAGNMGQIHPIFLTQHEKTKDKSQTTLEWISDMTRLFFETFVKLLDILVDATVQLARILTWIVAILGVIVVLTIITGTSEEFVGLVNNLLQFA